MKEHQHLFTKQTKGFKLKFPDFTEYEIEWLYYN